NADNPGGNSIQFDRRANRSGGASEARLPESMTDQSQMLPLFCLLGGETASERGPNTEQGKEVRRDPRETDPLGIAVPREYCGDWIEDRDVREVPTLRAPVLSIQIGGSALA